MLRCSRKSSARTSQKIRVPFAFQLYFLETFCNGKPTFATPFSFPDLGRERSRAWQVLFSLGLFSRRSYNLRDWQRITGTKNGFIGLHISDPVHTLF